MVPFEGLQEEKQPLVSILIPAYYSGEKLLDAIDSVMNQRYHNLEVIICDDGTEGFSPEKLRKTIQARWKEEPYRVRILHQVQNTGTVHNLNAGLSCAEGAWIMPLAADDILADNFIIEKLIDQANQGKFRWIVSRTELCDEQMNGLKAVAPPQGMITQLEKKESDEIYKNLCRNCCLPSSGNLYQKELLSEVGGFDERYRLVEDWPLFLKLFRRNEVPGVSSSICVKHRSGGVSRSNAAKNYTYQNDLVMVMEHEILPYLSGVEAKERKQLIRHIRDKEAVFQYRFQSVSKIEKIQWILTHMDVIARRFKKKGDSLC